MSFVLVTADFPDITNEQRTEIYEKLVLEKYVKVHEKSRDIDTVWYAKFAETITEAKCLEITINEFNECSKPYCKPKLVLHWGPNRPTFSGLT
jgi:hypothetical protein